MGMVVFSRAERVSFSERVGPLFHAIRIGLGHIDLDVKNVLAHSLSKNFFRFGQRYFKQTNGIAMGSRVSPPLPIAIIFMDAVESMMLSSTDLRPSIYLRFIDDIFGIWTHGPHTLGTFFAHIIT